MGGDLFSSGGHKGELDEQATTAKRHSEFAARTLIITLC